MRWTTLCAMLLAMGCGRTDTDDMECEDWDADGVCTEADQCMGLDDLSDVDADGVPDIDERDYLHSFEIPTVIFDTTSDELAFRMGYGQPGQAQASWDDFQPPMSLSYGGSHEVQVRTCHLTNWEAIEEELADGIQEAYMGLWIEGLEDDQDNFQIWPEDDLDLEGLEGARVNLLHLEVSRWVQDTETTSVSTQWSFYGYWE